MDNFVSDILFYVFAAFSISLAMLVVTTRRILRAAVYLMCVLGASAAFFILLGAEFLAGVQILVYIGGIVVLLVFAVMLTRSVDLLEERPTLVRKAIGGLAALSFFGTTALILTSTTFPVLRGGPLPPNNTAALGKKLLDYGSEGFVLPFEIISLLLLTAVIGGIVIARKTSVEKGGN
ncbi:MAG: hypothetical protein A2070_03415 [Bdellovibrionales bacterium GWC1_52_8]|nr:MAG: hypothetical protein A2Z97_02740 [Bdellovibrionales bacterium GWB1_52_6]OFZ05815.1 MAG: hypothetical protein A2X97_03890 [Bdellovibrionales bacterium GWA1_52_35]OFZ32508.1 MAG: hypothetical protein A2070_03415 [Bdellovibrionales bacterium GWC1_52_8]